MDLSDSAFATLQGGGGVGGDIQQGGVGGDGIEELPLFTVSPVDLQFSIAADFVAAQVANDVLILALSNGRILRIDLDRPQDIDGEFFFWFFLGRCWTDMQSCVCCVCVCVCVC
jgi:hypothetical protein